MIQVTEESREDLALLVQEEVLKSGELLLVEKLFHDLEEVTCQDGKGILIFVKELTDAVHEGVVGLR